MKLQKGTGLANGKIILAGEHAVVYHKPAIALPINAVFVKADIVTAPKGQTIECELYSGDLQSMPASMAGLQFAIFTCLFKRSHESCFYPLHRVNDSSGTRHGIQRCSKCGGRACHF